MSCLLISFEISNNPLKLGVSKSQGLPINQCSVRPLGTSIISQHGAVH